MLLAKSTVEQTKTSKMLRTVSLVLAVASFSWGMPLEPQLDNIRVVGGNDARQGQFPYQISIRRAATGGHNCGGSILNSKWILTAAHCVDGTSPSDWFIQSGSSLLSSGGTFHNLARMIIHEDYSLAWAIRNDIAVLELQEEIVFSDYARPIELETGDVGAVDATVSGWGLLWSGGSVPDNLQYLNLRTITNEQCQAVWGATMVGPDEICAVGEVGQGVCSADSGGPLVANGRQIGVVSWGGNPCGSGRPDGYGRVSSFVEWIEKAISS